MYSFPASHLPCSRPSFAWHSSHRLGQNLVHLRDLRADAVVDRAVADLDNQAPDNLRVDLRHDLELLALAVLGLGDRGLEAAEELFVESLQHTIDQHLEFLQRWTFGGTGGGGSYRCARDDDFHLASIRTHERAVFLAYPLQQAQAVVLRKRHEEVLDSATLVCA